MNNNNASRYSSILEQRAALMLEELGFEVQMEPSLGDLRITEINYKPDILATDSRGNKFIIEVKSISSASNMEKYFDFSRSLPKDGKWKFMIITNREIDRGLKGLFTPYPEKLAATLDNIDKSKNSLNKLAASEDTDDSIKSAVFLVKFSNLESSLSLLAEKLSLPIGSLMPKIMIDYLYSEGEVNFDLYEQIVDIIRQRNTIAHNSFSDRKVIDLNSIDEAQEKVLQLILPTTYLVI